MGCFAVAIFFGVKRGVERFFAIEFAGCEDWCSWDDNGRESFVATGFCGLDA